MKRVLTITFHRANNYGAMLQTYALQKVLEKKYETAIIDYYCDYVFENYELLQNPKNFKAFLISFLKLPVYYSRYKNFSQFRKQLKFTKKYKNINELKEDPPTANAYVVGSDQVWNPILTNGFDEAYFLNFGNKKTKRIAYAASCGKSEFILENKTEFKKNIHDFSAISVREKNIEQLIQELFDKKVLNVLDPSLLLTKEDWLKLKTSQKIIKEKFIFAYSVGNASDLYYDVVNELARKTGYLIVFFDRTDKEKKFHFKKKSCYSCGPVQFINLLLDSEFVITTSFHGLALSSVLNKKFFITLSTYPDRLLTLMNNLGLQNRIINDINRLSDLFKEEIDWTQVNEKLETARKDSLKWLYDSIEK